MKSKTSCFNATVFRKNLTRFAPVWGIYTLGLILGVLLFYSNGGELREYWFAAHYSRLLNYGGLLNFAYALLTAQLLFGALFNARMCNALHALPPRRESWFATNVLSGLSFSLVPTALMTLIGLALMPGSMVENAWQIPLYTFMGLNLQYICFFGMAVFSAMCAGSRVSMAMVYAILNFGAFAAYWIVDTVYTPMLYGVVTPSAWAVNLTPVGVFVDDIYLEVPGRGQLYEQFGPDLVGATAEYTLAAEPWTYLLAWTAAGIGFTLLALVLYKKRHLECAGDAMAFRVLEPVFLTLVSVSCGAASQFFVSEIPGVQDAWGLVFFAIGIVVGWFACKMLIARSTRVFAPRNWAGLGILAAVIALSLLGTRFDILGIEDRIPDASDVRSVILDYREDTPLTDPEDIQKLLRLQEIALEDRAENAGEFILDESGNLIPYIRTVSEDGARTEQPEIFYANSVRLRFELNNGKIIERRYPVWVSGESEEILRDILSRWEFVSTRAWNADNGVEMALANLDAIVVDGVKVPKEMVNRETAESLLAAVRADCEAGTMVQEYTYHDGCFAGPMDNEEGWGKMASIGVYLDGTGAYYNYWWSVQVYPDSENTVNWLRDHGLLAYEVLPERAW